MTYDPVLAAILLGRIPGLGARSVAPFRAPSRRLPFRLNQRAYSGFTPGAGQPKTATSRWPHPIYQIADEGGRGAPLIYPGGKATVGAPGASPTQDGVIYEVVRNTSAAAVAPTQQAEYLVGIVLENGAINGSLQYLYDGVHSAIFPAPSGGLSAAGTIGPPRETYFPLNIGPLGSGLTAAAQTWTNLVAAYFIMANRQNPAGHSFADLRGVYNQNESSAASGVAETYTIPGVQAAPLGFTAMMSLAATATGIPYADATFPAIGNYATYKVPFTQDFDAPWKVWPVPTYDPATSYVVTHNTISLGGATDIWLGGVLWY